MLGLLMSFKVDESPEPDGICACLLKEARVEIWGALTSIFVPSLATGKVPEDWRVAKTCGGMLMKDQGLLKSPGFPDLYPNNLHCIWLIRTPNYKNKIFLQFTKFQVEQFINCYSDRVIIYDGGSLESTVLDGPTCGSENPAVVSSEGSLLVEFFSSRTWRAYGFSAKIQFVECGYTLTNKKGNIDFRAWKKDDLKHKCWWALLIPRSFKIVFTLITLHIRSNENCTADYLAIHDVAANPHTLLGKYCGKLSEPVTFTSTGRTLVLELSHLKSDLGWGFSAEYKSIITSVMFIVASGQQRTYFVMVCLITNIALS
ncbi:embryonic protein UVS.2-like [Hypanus sabinus]|uniref:embryonic protein UVS.2-like n=1 Tax=Hypanus sabinus TaxID=79690 RepID=UPI0028C4599F|nr:embryonic protein UVS.2-like [Hypanus sabinus]